MVRNGAYVGRYQVVIAVVCKVAKTNVARGATRAATIIPHSLASVQPNLLWTNSLLLTWGFMFQYRVDLDAIILLCFLRGAVVS